MIDLPRSAARIVPALLLAAVAAAAPVSAGQTLDAVMSRGRLRCGVSEGIAGFSDKDSSGRWTGFDVDFCRAVAAAVLGDPEKVSFVPLRASARFPALQAGTIDLLVRNTTWTLGREAGMKLQFPGILLFDGQGFMVPAATGVRQIAQLSGATICVVKGSTSLPNLLDHFAARGLRVTPLVLDSVAAVADAFFSGRCGAYTSDATQLAAARLRAPGGQEAYVILAERISKEPLGPVVRRGDDDWFTVVRWVLFALTAAEEAGLTRDNVAARIAGLEGGFGAALGLRDDWAVRAVQAVGNYGEMFERNLGRRSALQLERGHNRLWTEGGLLYAPPLR